MFTQIVYLPKFGTTSRSDDERLAIAGLHRVADSLNISVYAWDARPTSSVNKKILFVSLGGDGTMLTAMREATKYPESTVFGINFGKLGFLTSINKHRLAMMYPRIDNALYTLFTDIAYGSNRWELTQRMAIGATIGTSNYVINNSVAINEFLITTPTRRNPLQYEIYINDKFMASQHGDGVIVSTASGSTAYALSAGGAIMTPSSTALQIVPLAAHTLTAKPVVVMGGDQISIRASLDQRANKIAVFNDGCDSSVVDSNSGSRFQLDIVDRQMVNVWYPKDWNFFNVLSEKMGW